MAVRKTAKGAALKRWFKEEWKDVQRERHAVVEKVRSVARRIADLVKGFLAKLRKRQEK